MPITDYYYKIDETKPKNLILLNLLKTNNLSVRELGRRIGIAPERISVALNKNRIEEKTMQKIADYFGVKVEEMFNEVYEREAYRNKLKKILKEITDSYSDFSKRMAKVYDEINFLLKYS